MEAEQLEIENPREQVYKNAKKYLFDYLSHHAAAKAERYSLQIRDDRISERTTHTNTEFPMSNKLGDFIYADQDVAFHAKLFEEGTQYYIKRFKECFFSYLQRHAPSRYQFYKVGIRPKVNLVNLHYYSTSFPAKENVKVYDLEIFIKNVEPEAEKAKKPKLEAYNFKKGYDIDPNKLYMGIELEVENKTMLDNFLKGRSIDYVNNDSSRAYKLRELMMVQVNEAAEEAKFSLPYIFKHDGSLQYGIEIVTDPIEIERLRANLSKFYVFMKELSKRGFTSHDNGRCGLHFHLSSSPLLAVTKIPEITGSYMNSLGMKNSAANAYLAGAIYNKLHNLATRLCRRNTFEYCNHNKNTGQYLNHRKSAINLTHYTSTYELRIFRGTLNFTSFLIAANFALLMYEEIKNYLPIYHAELEKRYSDPNAANRGEVPILETTKLVLGKYKDKDFIAKLYESLDKQYKPAALRFAQLSHPNLHKIKMTDVVKDGDTLTK